MLIVGANQGLAKWTVTVNGELQCNDVMFGELRFLDSHTSELPKLYRKPNLGQLTVNDNSPIFSDVKFWRVSPNFMYTECFLSLQHVLQNACCFCVGLNLLFIPHAYRKPNKPIVYFSCVSET